MRKNLIVLQEGSRDCGSASLLSIIRYFGGDISLERLREMTLTTKDGTNFYNICEAALKIGLLAKCFKVDKPDKINEINMPCLVQLKDKNYTHFVVVYKCHNDKVLMMDPAKGKVVTDLFTFSNKWTGYIMMFEKKRELPLYHKEKYLNKILLTTLINNKKIIISLILLSIIFTILTSFTSLYSNLVLDRIIDTSFNNLIIITVIFSIFLITKNITGYIRNILIIYLNQKLDLNIIVGAFRKIILLPFIYYKNRPTGEVLSRINDLSYIKKFITKTLITITLDLFTFIVSFIILFNINKELTFITMLLSLIYFGIIISFNPFIRRLTITNQENNVLINNAIVENVSSYNTIKGLNIERKITTKFSRLYSKALEDLRLTDSINNMLILSKDLTSDLGNLIISFASIKLMMDKVITIGNYMTFTLLTNYLTSGVKNLIDIIFEYHYTKNSLDRANSLLELEGDKLTKRSNLKVIGDIRIINLSYTFNNKNYILKNFTLKISSGEKILMLGPSGGGKSTILKLIYRYYNIERNKILINNIDINDYTKGDIRSNISYLSQNETLFTDSIKNNIILDRNISEKEFIKICKLTYIDEIIKNNILGYDYLLEENGVNVSGGERQRIILARTLLKRSSIIMIDEGLNALDVNIERKILKNIFREFNDKTVIIVSHRYNNMDLYNRVLKIKDGKIYENIRGMENEL